MNGENNGGPLKRIATWIAEKIAGALLGPDVLSPDHEGTDIDWGDAEFKKPRQTIVATLARIQLELTLDATNRRLETKLNPESCAELVQKAKTLAQEQNHGAKLSEDCAITITGLTGGDLEAEVSGAGPEFDALCDELWERSKKVQEGLTKKPDLSQIEDGLKIN